MADEYLLLYLCKRVVLYYRTPNSRAVFNQHIKSQMAMTLYAAFSNYAVILDTYFTTVVLCNQSACVYIVVYLSMFVIEIVYK